MGGGTWSPDTFFDNKSKLRGKDAFQHTANMLNKDQSKWRVNEALDPHGVNRESRDSEEHPQSVGIVVAIDVTGSNGKNPRIVQSNLPTLLGLLQGSGVKDPQIMFMGVGDHHCDKAPLQVGQFESDNRMDKDLERIFIEEGGCGGGFESYLLAMHFLARHTTLDCVEKRDHKGYFFLLADELPREELDHRAIQEVLGHDVREDIPANQIFRELQEKYEVFILFPTTGSGYSGNTRFHNHWRQIFPERLILVDPQEMPQTIAAIVASREGQLTGSALNKQLKKAGVSEDVLTHLDVSGVNRVEGNIPGL